MHLGITIKFFQFLAQKTSTRWNRDPIVRREVDRRSLIPIRLMNNLFTYRYLKYKLEVILR